MSKNFLIYLNLDNVLQNSESESSRIYISVSVDIFLLAYYSQFIEHVKVVLICSRTTFY